FLTPEILTKIEQADMRWQVVFIQKLACITMTDTEKDDIDIFLDFTAERKLGFVEEVGMNRGKGFAAIAFTMGEDERRVGVVNQQPYQVTAGGSCRTNDSDTNLWT